jgi:hypothetical protein
VTARPKIAAGQAPVAGDAWEARPHTVVQADPLPPNPAPRRAGGSPDTPRAAALSEVHGAAAMVADTYPEVAAYLRSCPPGLVEHLTRGEEHRHRTLLDERDRLLVELGAVLRQPSIAATARVVSETIARYASTVWPRTRIVAACPHDAGTVQSMVWRCLSLHDHPPAWKTVQTKLLAAGHRGDAW